MSYEYQFIKISKNKGLPLHICLMLGHFRDMSDAEP